MSKESLQKGDHEIILWNLAEIWEMAGDICRTDELKIFIESACEAFSEFLESPTLTNFGKLEAPYKSKGIDILKSTDFCRGSAFLSSF